MDLKSTLKRGLTVCVTITIMSTTMVLAKGKAAPEPTRPARNAPPALSPESVRVPNLKADKRPDSVAKSTIDMAAIKSPAELKAAVRKALASKAVAARMRARLGNVNYRLLTRALDEPVEPGVETQAVSAWSCWFSCLRAAGVGLYSATVCAATCALGVIPACVVCAAISGTIAYLCALACSHTIVRDDGTDKGEILN